MYHRSFTFATPIFPPPRSIIRIFCQIIPPPTKTSFTHQTGLPKRKRASGGGGFFVCWGWAETIRQSLIHVDTMVDIMWFCDLLRRRRRRKGENHPQLKRQEVEGMSFGSSRPEISRKSSSLKKITYSRKHFHIIWGYSDHNQWPSNIYNKKLNFLYYVKFYLDTNLRVFFSRRPRRVNAYNLSMTRMNIW